MASLDVNSVIMESINDVLKGDEEKPVQETEQGQEAQATEEETDQVAALPQSAVASSLAAGLGALNLRKIIKSVD